MFRKILAAVAGIVSALAVFMVVEGLSKRLYPYPAGLDPQDHHAMAAYITKLPSTALLVVLLGWVAGSLICGFVIGVLSRSSAKTPSYIAGLFLTVSGIVNLFMFPHPIWFVIMGTTVFIPFTLLGHIMVPRRIAQPD